MEGEEPTTGLVNTFCDEVGRIDTAIVERFLVFERIVDLCVWHRTRIKPHVDKVEFAGEYMSRLADKLDVIHIRTMEVNLLVIVLLHQSRNKALLLERILCHHTGSNGLLNLVIEFLDRTDAQFLAGVTVAPDRQWCAPVARTAEVPVIEVLEPCAKASGTRRFRLPVDGLVELDHPVTASGGTDEPRVERIIEHRLVGTPAMWIVVHMLLDLEGLVLLLEAEAHDDVEVIGLLGSDSIILAVLVELRSIGILHEAAFMNAICIEIDTLLDKGGSKLLALVVLARQVNHWTCFAQSIDHIQCRNLGSLGNLGIISTEGRSNMHDARTVLSGHIVTGDDAESLLGDLDKLVLTISEDLLGMLLGILLDIWSSKFVQLLTWLHPLVKLLILHAYKVTALVTSYDAIRKFAAIHLVEVKSLHLGKCMKFLACKISLETCFGHNDGQLVTIVGIEGLNGYVVDIRANAKCGIRRQGPRCSGPSNENRLSPLGHLRPWIKSLEDSGHRGILHITIAAGLVELVARKTSSCSRRIRLDGISLVEKALVIELLEEPPEGFDITVVISDIRIIEIDPITHLAGQVGPLLRIFHDLLAASCIVVVHRNLLADVLLGDAEHLLDAQLNRKSVSIPSCLALHLEALHRLETAEYILNRTSHYVMNTRHTIGRRGTLVEDKRRMALTCGHRFNKDVFGVPILQNLFIDF